MGVVGLDAADAEMVERGDGDALRLRRDEKDRQVSVAVFLWSRAREAEDIVGHVCTGAPALCPRKQDAVALAAGHCLDHCEVAADIGFGQTIGKQQLACGHPRKKRFLLCLGALLDQVHAGVAGGHDVGTGYGRGASCEFLDDDHRADEVDALPAILLGDSQAHHAHLCQRIVDVAGEDILAIPVARLVTRHVALDEATGAFTQELVVGAFHGHLACRSVRLMRPFSGTIGCENGAVPERMRRTP